MHHHNKTFVSYNRKDLGFARRFVASLHNRGVDSWFDMEDLEPGVVWSSEMLLGVQCSYNFVFIITSNSVVSEPCAEELACALRHEKRLIPVLRENVAPGLIHKSLRELQWIFLRVEDDFNFGMTRLIRVLDAPKNVNPLTDRKSAELIVIDEQGTRVIGLQRESYLVGRQGLSCYESGSIIVYGSRAISRHHLKIYFDHGQWRVRDQSSNGIKLSPPSLSGVLEDGMTIELAANSGVRLIYREIGYEALPPEDDTPTIF
jgi:hypothetical protein